MIELHPEEARAYLVGHLGLARPAPETGREGVRALLRRLRCIQLDPLDRIGTNADLVALARVDDLRKGEVYDHLLPGAAFEHFAKERCLIPAAAFPYYREQAPEAAWWRSEDRKPRAPAGVIEAVYQEIRDRGPLTVAEMTDHGSVDPLDWNGWKGTDRATTLAVEVLWTECRVVVTGRTPGGKRYDVPERALPEVARRAPPMDFGEWGVLERAEAAGLLSTASGPHWSMLGAVRRSEVPRRLVDAGRLAEVQVAGSRRTYLAPADFRERLHPEPDRRMRILGPLDPLLWDRNLVRQVFDFEYVWEVYKPRHKRRWGYYVCPLLHRGHLVGRIEARVDEGRLEVESLWEEPRGVDRRALAAALRRHARALGVRPPDRLP